MARSDDVRYVPDRAGTAAFARSREVSGITLAAARAGAVFMEAIAPVLTGTYRGRFEAEATTIEVGGHKRAGAIIRNTDPKAHLVEYHNRARVMQQGLDYVQQLYSSRSGRR